MMPSSPEPPEQGEQFSIDPYHGRRGVIGSDRWVHSREIASGRKVYIGVTENSGVGHVSRMIFMLVLAVVFGAGGALLGYWATQMPTVATERSDSEDIFVQPVREGDRFILDVYFDTKDGTVHFATDANLPGVVELRLRGDARLRSVQPPAVITDAGDGEQQLLIGDAEVVGVPERDWASTRNGYTEVRTPTAILSPDTSGENSVLRMSILGPYGTNLDSFSPADVAGGEVEVVNGSARFPARDEGNTQMETTGPSITWAVAPSRREGLCKEDTPPTEPCRLIGVSGPETDLLPATARFSAPEAIVRAQLLVLVAGTLLGLAAAALFALFERPARRFRSA